MTRPPCVRLYPAYPGNPRLRIEGESPQSEKDIQSSLIRATLAAFAVQPTKSAAKIIALLRAKPMERPKFYVDFNELIEADVVALSASDHKLSTSGKRILLQDGMLIDVYSDDLDDDGNPDNLVASGVVERNSATGWTKDIKWCCRVDAHGIRHASGRCA